MIRALVLLLALAGCSVSSTTTPFLFDHDDAVRADAVIIAVPGALTSIEVLRPAEALAAPDRAVVYYRLPGLDGRPATDPLRVETAADSIVRFTAHYGFKRVYLIGFSTGAAISFEAAKRIRVERPDTEVAIAAISSALPSPQPTLAGLRGLRGNVAAAVRTRSLDPRTIWLEYYRTLLFGGHARQDARDRAAASQTVDANAPRIEVPDPRVAATHALALTGWGNPRPERLDGTAMAFFHGARDPVFPLHAVRAFSESLPGRPLHVTYDRQGHLILLTQPTLWFDIAQFFGFNPRLR